MRMGTRSLPPPPVAFLCARLRHHRHPFQSSHAISLRPHYLAQNRHRGWRRLAGHFAIHESILLECISLKQGWAAVALDGSNTLEELRSLYEHLRTRILELIETLGELRASPDFQLYQFAEQDEAVIPEVIESQKSELEKEIEALEAEAKRKAAEIEELVGECPL